MKIIFWREAPNAIWIFWKKSKYKVLIINWKAYIWKNIFWEKKRNLKYLFQVQKTKFYN